MQTQTVATILGRYQRRRKCQVPVAESDVYAETIARVCGDYADLDPVEWGLIHLKRHRVISGRRMVNLLGRHQREIKPERGLAMASWGSGLNASYEDTKRHRSGRGNGGFKQSMNIVHVRRSMVICPGSKGGDQTFAKLANWWVSRATSRRSQLMTCPLGFPHS